MSAYIRIVERRPKLSGITLATAFVVLLSACSTPFNLANNEPLSTYLLEWHGLASTPPYNPTGSTLSISTPLSSSGFGTSQMVYVEEPYRLKAFARHQWVDAPARMLEPLLLAAAEQSGLFHAVTNADVRVSSDLRLDTLLLYLRQVFDDNKSEVQLALRVSLIKNKASQLLGTQVIEVRKPVAERTPYAGVLASNQAVTELLIELQRFLARNVP